MKKHATIVLILLFFAILAITPRVEAQRLAFSMIQQDPDPVHAGDVVEVRFKVENLWDETLTDVSVEILPEYPFSLYEESALKNLGRIEKRRSYEAVFFDFKLKVDQDAVDGEHEIKLKASQGNTVWTLEDMFYIDIESEKLEIKPYIVASDLITGGAQGTFTIEIANTGGQDVEALQLTLEPSQDYKLLSTTNYIYLGDLESDDTESEDFHIYVNEETTTVTVPIILTFEANDKTYTQDHILTLNLLTEEEAKHIGLIKKNTIPYIIGALIAVIIAILIARRIMKR